MFIRGEEMDNYDNRNTKSKYSVPAIENAFKIIHLLSRKRFRESTLTEIATATSLSPATCYRILNSLEKEEVVRFIKDKKRYTLGVYLVVLGDRAKEHIDYISLIKPYLEALTVETGITAILVKRIGKDKLTIVTKVEGDDYGVHVSVGRHFSITNSSYGISILAYLDPIDRIQCIENSKMENAKSTEFIEQEVMKAREKGFYATYGEYIKGIWGLAAPIFNEENKVDMAIALIGMTVQFSREEIDEMGEKVKHTADRISKRMNPYQVTDRMQEL